jgi:hypothetical protein
MRTLPGGRPTRRTVIAGGLGVAGVALSTLAAERGLLPRRRDVRAARTVRSDVQHDVVDLLPPAVRLDGTLFRFGPAHTLFLTHTLSRTPTRSDQQRLAAALDRLESAYPASMAGLFVVASYGRPYLDRLRPDLVERHLPRLLADPARSAFEDAEPAPTDVHSTNPGVRKQRFNTPVRLEEHEVLLTLRSDSVDVLAEAAAWLAGGGELAGKPAAPPALDLLERTGTRLMFHERGLPRRLADAAGVRWSTRVHPDSPLWMGFADGQADSSGPAAITTFTGNPSARLTTAAPGDYLDLGSVQHLSHTVLDLEQFYLGEGGSSGDSETYEVRAQYMFRANPTPARGTGDRVTDGGGPAFVRNEFRDPADAERGARGERTDGGVRRIGHAAAFQRASRAADGTPLHIRVDGPGFDSLDVETGVRTPKLQFSVFMPTADSFARMRRAGAATDLVRQHRVPAADHGLERFCTTTRRQNFLVPPRRHRAFPFVELDPEDR